MGDQVALADKVLGAEVTPKGPVGSRTFVMAAHVEQQVPLQREALAALVTRKGSLAAVRSADVVDQVLLVVEGLVAHVTGMRRLARVLSQVVRQVLLPRERLLTELAPVRGVPRVDAAKEMRVRLVLAPDIN